jgi:hypothetical protein
MLINIKMSCRNICTKYKAIVDGKLRAQGIGVYLQGFKRCNTCDIFLTDEGISKNKCICCKNRVTVKPKLKKTRLRRLRDKKIPTDIFKVSFV